jgi:hypothetical protein
MIYVGSMPIGPKKLLVYKQEAMISVVLMAIQRQEWLNKQQKPIQDQQFFESYPCHQDTKQG